MHADAVDEVVELDGALVTPTFVDAHVHLSQTGQGLAGVDLLDAPSLAVGAEPGGGRRTAATGAPALRALLGRDPLARGAHPHRGRAGPGVVRRGGLHAPHRRPLRGGLLGAGRRLGRARPARVERHRAGDARVAPRGAHRLPRGHQRRGPAQPHRHRARRRRRGRRRARARERRPARQLAGRRAGRDRGGGARRRPAGGRLLGSARGRASRRPASCCSSWGSTGSPATSTSTARSARARPRCGRRTPTPTTTATPTCRWSRCATTSSPARWPAPRPASTSSATRAPTRSSRGCRRRPPWWGWTGSGGPGTGWSTSRWSTPRASPRWWASGVVASVQPAFDAGVGRDRRHVRRPPGRRARPDAQPVRRDGGGRAVDGARARTAR